VNEITAELKQKFGLPVWVTQDWHPSTHCSFPQEGQQPFVDTYRDSQGKSQRVWPQHCVAGSVGAKVFLNSELVDFTFLKGQDPWVESYSAFRDEAGRWSELRDQLHTAGRKFLVVYGLATDFCVKHSILDARELGFEVLFVPEGSRGVFLDPTLSVAQLEQSVLQEFHVAGVQVV
jgi:nicotinamidase/pyrazinamidase